MKTFFASIFIFLCALNLSAQNLVNPYRFGTAYVLKEDFEGSGYQNSWTEGGTGTVDEDATGLDGAQGLMISGTVQQPRTTNTLGSAYSSLDYFFLFQMTNIPAATVRFFEIKDSSGASAAIVSILTDGTLRITPAGGLNATTTDAMSVNTTNRIWVHYEKGTGANAIGSVAFSTDDTRPLSGNKFKSSTNGTGTTDVQTEVFGRAANATWTIWVDKFRINPSIGDSPP